MNAVRVAGTQPVCMTEDWTAGQWGCDLMTYDQLACSIQQVC